MKIVSKSASVHRVMIETKVEGNGEITTITANVTLKTLLIQTAYILSHLKIIITIKGGITLTTGSNNNRCQATSAIHHLLICKTSGNLSNSKRQCLK